VDVTGSGNTYTFKMPSGGATVTAAFEAQEAGTYPVIIGTFAGGSVVTDKSSAKLGEIVTLTVTPDAGYERKDLTVNRIADDYELTLTLSGGNLTFHMPTGGVKVTAAEFTAIVYTVNSVSSGNGTVISSPTTAIVGDEITVTATADTEYRLVGKPTVTSSAGSVTVTLVSGNTYKFNMPPANATVTAVFTAITYPVTDSSGPNGSVSGLASAAGAQVTLTVNADTGFQLKAGTLTVKDKNNGTVTPTPGSGNTWTFTMPSGGVTVEAEFETVEANKYTIGFDLMTHGSVSADPPGPVVEGTLITLTVTPDEDYQLKAGSLTVSGGAMVSGSGPTYTFSMPAANVTVAAEFEEKPVQVPEGYTPIDSAATLALIGVDTENYPLNGKYFQTKSFEIAGTWTPIGSQNTPFTGEYDGNGKVITPNNVVATENFGIFLYTDGAKFKNVHIGQGSITSSSDTMGGIVSQAASTDFTNCSNAATLISKREGGIGYSLSGTSTIDHCWNSGSITSEGSSAGGICGNAASGSAGNIVIRNCYNEGSISGSNSGGSAVAGGIVGNINVANVIACYNTGTVTVTGKTINAGGIAGVVGGHATNGTGYITACYNTGTVSSSVARQSGGKIYLGGITGFVNGGYVIVTASYNAGTVSYTGTGTEGNLYLGGIGGYQAETITGGNLVKAAEITACYWKTEGNPANGIGARRDQNNQTEASAPASNTGTTKFADAWPTNSTHTDWGTDYWKSISNGVYPKLAWEQ
jgi:hypothetical protein